MSNDFDKFWDELTKKYRRKRGLAPSPEELESSANSGELDEPLSDEEIESIVSAVSRRDSKRKADIDVSPDVSWISEIDTSSIADGVLQLNRNRGESQTGRRS
jgi:hypothetical protein